jgi:NDP-sugar pyrophosphorylase family protein
VRNLHIVLPMAGYGSRFTKAGVTTPKPLIPVDGKPMFLKAIASFDRLDTPKRYTAILRKEHVDHFSLDRHIKRALPEVNIVVTDEPATGALQDAYRSEVYLKPDEGIIVMDCDIEIGGDRYFEMIKRSLSNEYNIEGGLLLFSSNDQRFSYAEVDSQWRVLRTAEKQVISPYAIGGGYYISTTQTFLSEAKKVFMQPLSKTRPEYFMSYLFNQILADAGTVSGAPGNFRSFGTPEELAAYEAGHLAE